MMKKVIHNIKSRTNSKFETNTDGSKPDIDRKAAHVHTSPERKYLWIKYVVYFWAIRLGLHGVGILFPMAYGIWYIMFGGNLELVSKYHIKPIERLSYDKSIIRQMNTKYAHPNQPYVITNMSLIEAQSLDDIISFTIRSLTSQAKISNHSDFTYFTQKKLWSSYYDATSIGYELTSIRNIPRFKQISDMNIQDDNVSYQHWYISQPIPASIQSTWISSISSFANMIHARKNIDHVDANVLLWCSSMNVSVRFHYDMDINYYLQLSGSKTFILAKPAAYAWLHPYSSFHPLWRQSHHHHHHHSLDLSDRSLYINITLHAGDMLIIPPFYFHHVIAGEHSASMNAWFPSQASFLYQRLISGVRLPYHSSDSIQMQLASLGRVTWLVLEAIDTNTSMLIDHMMHRYPDHDAHIIDNTCMSDDIQEHDTCLNHMTIEQCDSALSPLALGLIHKSEAAIIDILRALPHHDAGIEFLLFMDYMEENLLLILEDGKNIMPSTIRSFIMSCIKNTG